MMEPIKTYTGQDIGASQCLVTLEGFIGDMDNAELTDDSTVDTSDAVTAINGLVYSLEKRESEIEQLRLVAWAAYRELNEIRARDGVPYNHLGYKASVDEEYFSRIVDALHRILGDDAKPWPAKRWLNQDGSFEFPGQNKLQALAE